MPAMHLTYSLLHNPPLRHRSTWIDIFPKHCSSLYPVRGDRTVLFHQAITELLDEFGPRLSARPSAEAVKSLKQRRTLKQMFLDVKEPGYEGSYDRVAALGRQWKVGQMARRANQQSVANFIIGDAYSPFFT